MWTRTPARLTLLFSKYRLSFGHRLTETMVVLMRIILAICWLGCPHCDLKPELSKSVILLTALCLAEVGWFRPACRDLLALYLSVLAHMQ